MLTPAAWNAFLKTLEEPPPHTIFVLATTEANKVLPTVVDRCHRFDFGRPVACSQIASVLRRVADAESIEIPDEAVALVARSATGSFRDALGTLEQLLAYSGSTIALDDVLAVLGAADADLLFGDRRRGRRRRRALRAARRRPPGRVRPRPRPLLRRPRGPRPRPDGRPGARRGARPSCASRPSRTSAWPSRPSASAAPSVVRLLELIAAALRAMKDGADARTQLELALVKAASRARAVGQGLQSRSPGWRPLRPRRRRRAKTPPASRAAAEPPAGRRARQTAAAPPARPPGPRTPRTPRRAPATPRPPAARPRRPSPTPQRGRTAVAITAQVDGPATGGRRDHAARRRARRPAARRSTPPTTPRPPSRRSSPPRPIRRRP